MARFKHTDNGQGQFIAVNLKEQIALGTFEWTVSHIIDKADMSLFEKKYHNDAKGAAAYPPTLLLKVILFCYSRGIITSRKIERAYKENSITKALAEDLEPGHDTVSKRGVFAEHAPLLPFVTMPYSKNEYWTRIQINTIQYQNKIFQKR